MQSLRGKVAILTGAAGGMGEELSRALAAEGMRLILSSRSADKLEAQAAALRGEGAEATACSADVTREDEVERLFRTARDLYGSADVLINLAGLSIPAQVQEMTLEQYRTLMDVNVLGTFLCCKHFIPLVSADAGAQIINVGSMAAKRANANAPVYCTAKAAVQMFSQGLALQVKEKRIRVTTLNPGGTDTGFWGDRPVAREKLLQSSDVADAIVFVLKRPSHVVVHELAFESSLM